MTTSLMRAVQAAQEKKALEVRLLELKGICSFTDYFLICSGTSSRQNQAISDAILTQLESMEVSPAHMEGYNQGEWILMDYWDFVVHIFSERARGFYDLERLWRSAPRLPVPESVP